MKAWIALAFGIESGPYADQAGVSYAYDSFVQNHKQVRLGDLLFLRNRSELEGIGRIERIESGVGIKVLHRCPNCNATVRLRNPDANLDYRCTSGHVFRKPLDDSVSVKTFQAFFDGSYLKVEKNIEADELRRFHLRQSNQMAIMPVSLNEITQFVATRLPMGGDLLLQWASNTFTGLMDDDADDEPDPTSDGRDQREIALKGIRLRRGQRQFREKLLSRYKASCAISGCQVVGVLEAAHIRPYRGEADHHPANGLLLRSDLHVLFDLDRLGIDPESLEVVLHPTLHNTEYSVFHRKKLAINSRANPDKNALRQRWLLFLRSSASAGAK